MAPRARDGAATPTPRALTSLALLLLTASAGAADAVGYLALDHVFTGNMTGNVLFLGFAVAGAPGVAPLGNAGALAGFVAGAALAGRAVPRASAPVLPRAVLGTLLAVTAGSGLLCAAWAVSPDLTPSALLVLACLLAALSGAQATAVKATGNADITTVVVTSTLVNLVRASRLAGAPPGPRHVWLDRALAIVVIAAGAAVGALLVRWTSGPVALGAVVLLRGGAVVALAAARRAQTSGR